ncbi:double-strand break repair protein AddB [Terrarubrum flagellatum]|uniref:double-strand break repair protein AddB n=1 Tax=Terrirubrum flagellatum TaxID=2895980 RepID=UPI003144D68D
MRPPRLFSIPPGALFLDTLADALIDGTLVGDIGWKSRPLDVADVTIYLPTRRAARAFAGVLALRADGPAILPRIVPLGDADEAELKLMGDGDVAPEALLQPAAESADRMIFLADLVMRWRKQLALAITPLDRAEHGLIAESPAEAFALAGDLARVLDILTIEGVTPKQLSDGVPGEHDRYWEISRAFLGIAFETWPLYLETRGLIDPTARNQNVLRARAAQIAAGKSSGPVIAAGSTGTNPATAELLSAIARLDRGAVVLPGLDLISSNDSFAAILGEEAPHEVHPQAALAHLLRRLQAQRGDVIPLGRAQKALLARERVLSDAMQPPSQTASWADARADAAIQRDIRDALRGGAIIEADTDREEALAIALAMRRAVRRPNRSAALVTPDRALAERVGVTLARWGLEVDDSAGRALSRAPRGALAILAAQWLASPADGALLSTLLAHPSVACGFDRAGMVRAATAIEIGLLRGYPDASDLKMLRELFEPRRSKASDRHAIGPLKRLSEDDWTLAREALDRLIAISDRFAGTGDKHGCACVGEWAAAHREALVALTENASEEDWLFDEPDGDALRELFGALEIAGAERAPLTRADYPLAIKQLMDGETLNPPARIHPRLAIWGLLEARLLQADVMILGGLNETSWPPQPSPDPFLNRALRSTLKLPQPERRIGQTAHDFVAAFGAARQAILTRAKKSGGAPTIASRFWQRLQAYAGPQEKRPEHFSEADRRNPWVRATRRGDIYLAYARALDESGEAKPISQPSPKPPARLAPRQLSVSRIETLVRDPYAIFAQSVLKLDRLEPIGMAADFALRGTVIHDAAAHFSKTVDPFAANAVEEFTRIGEKLFKEAGVDPERMMFWLPGFRRAARAYVEWERSRRPHLARFDVEQGGKISFALGDGSNFTLSGRADRIERLKDRTLAIVDFKTGAPPSRKEVLKGLSPQLTLEAAMASRGGFNAEDRGRKASSLIYVRMSGAKSGGFDNDLADSAKKDFVDPIAIPEKHLEQLRRRMSALVSGELGFTSRPIPKYARDEGDYDHLARVAEWSRGDDDE